MLSAENFRSPEFPDGIGAKEFAGLYSAKDLYYDKGKFQHVGTPVEEETEQPAVTTDVKLQEELKNKPESEAATQSAGQIKTAGGSQGNVDSLKKSRKDKNTGEQVLDIGALDQITNLEAEADRIRERAVSLGSLADVAIPVDQQPIRDAHQKLGYALQDTISDLDVLQRAGETKADEALNRLRQFLTPTIINHVTAISVGGGMVGRG
jgi:hypothetical protein